MSMYGTDRWIHSERKIYPTRAINGLPDPNLITKELRLPHEVLDTLANITSPNGVQDIIEIKDPTTTLSRDWQQIITRVIGPHRGPEELTWPSPLAKVLYLSHLENQSIYPLPDYRHSCPDIDNMLVGAVPYANFVDGSRAGAAHLMPKAFAYADYANRKYLDESRSNLNLETMTDRERNFIDTFGLISCIPLMSRDALFQVADQEGYELALIGGSSIAEAFKAICRTYGNQELKDQVLQLSAQGKWLQGSDRSGTAKIKEKFERYMNDDSDRKLINIMLHLEKTPAELSQILQEKYKDYQYPVAQLVADYVMQMVREQTMIPNEQSDRDTYWKNAAYGTNGNLSRRDISEINIAKKIGGKREVVLKPMPWQSFVLYPHAETDKTFATKEQLIGAAELVKQYYPNSTVYLPTSKDGSPLTYNATLEKSCRDGHDLTPNTIILASIAHMLV